jgi:superfamily II DNA or RNA helicase
VVSCGGEALERVDAHRALPGTVDLLQVFAETEERSIREDYTFRYDNRFYQIEAHDACEAMRRSKVFSTSPLA